MLAGAAVSVLLKAENLVKHFKAVQAVDGVSLEKASEIRHIAERPTFEELRARIARLPPVSSSLSPAEIIREVRDRE